MNKNLIMWLTGGAIVLWLLSRYTETGKAIVQQITDAGISMIATFEGFSSKAYNDPPGSDKWSIGYGHQIQPGEEHLLTDTITVEQGKQMLADDTAKAQSVVRSTITYPLTPEQFDALTSFVYNVGSGNFKSGTVPAKINAGDLTAAAATMRQYNKSGGVVNKTLVARRDREASAFA
jgi:lysozyme